MDHENRIMEIPGLLNVRDLGGMPVEGGGETKFGRIFRGSQPDDIAETSVKELGVDRVIDLRTEAEWQDGRSSHIAQLVAERYEVSFLDGPLTEERLTGAAERGLTPTYVRFLENIEAVSEILSLMSDDSNLPTYFHCTFGKDRTGVVTALVLGAIGVHREAIVEDYALASRYIDEMMARRKSADPNAWKRMDAMDQELSRILMSADPITMENMLAAIDDKYGSPATYVSDLENGEAILEGLKHKLLAD